MRKTSERVALTVGAVLLAVYGAAALHRAVGAGAAIAVIEASSREATKDPRAEAVEFSLWSPKRIAAYRESLSLLRDDPLAVLTIERLQVKAPVFAGVSDLVLNRGVGWIPGTAAPGEPGNAGIAGHRDGFFRGLKDAAVGDAVILQTRKRRLLYRIDEIVIVVPEQVDVLRPRGEASITLVTCYPFYYVGDAPQRFIVHARLQEELAGFDSVQMGSPPRGRPARPKN